MTDALPAATLPIYPGLGRAQEYAGLHTRGFVTCKRNITKLECGPMPNLSVNCPTALRALAI